MATDKLDKMIPSIIHGNIRKSISEKLHLLLFELYNDALGAATRLQGTCELVDAIAGSKIGTMFNNIFKELFPNDV